MNRGKWIAVVSGAVVIAAIAWFVVSQHGQPSRQQVAYTNVSRNYRVCFASTSPETAAAAWHATQAAAAHAAINAQQVTVPTAPASQEVPYLNGLLALKCGVIITAGADLHDAATTVAKANPHQAFINVGSVLDLPNVRDLVDPSGITELVVAAANH